MINVILIDDEPAIREGLKSIIDWNAYGFNICGEASNGLEGLEKIGTLNAELAIVDVKMPTMDGLQMVAELNRRKIQCEYIILSAYSDFKYAQSAIELGIGCYILKPIEESELIDKLVKVRETIHNRKKTKLYIDMSVSLSRNRLVQQLVLGQLDMEDIDKYLSLYKLDFPWRLYQIGLIEMDKKSYETQGVRSKLEAEVHGFVSTYDLGLLFTIEHYTGILFKDRHFSTQHRMLSDLHDRIKRICKIDVTITVGPSVNSLEDLKISYRHACRLIEKKFIYGYKKIIINPRQYDENHESAQNSMGDWDVDRVIEDLYCAIDVENLEDINNILEDIRTSFTEHECDESIIKIHFSNIYTAIVSRLISNNDSLKSFVYIRQEVLAEICNKTSLQELHGYMKFIFVSLSEELAKLRPNDPIKRILDYIDRHYHQDLKLEGLAVLFHYNSAYLGKLVRAKTGVQFSTYLDNVRMEKACQLLKDGLKVYEVAQKVGYKYIDYFYRKFKKYAGVSPTDYKEMQP